MTTSPREPDERFAAYVDGAMSERERERFEAELRVNPPLAAALAEYEGTVASVRAALQAATAPVDLASRVMATIAAEPRGPVAVVGHNRGYRLFVSVAAAAALLVVAVLINALAERSLPVSESMATRDAQQPEGAFDGAWLGGGTGEAGAVAVGGVGEGGVGGEPEHGLGEILGRSDSRTGFVGVVTEDDPAATNPMAFNPAVPGDNTVIVPRQAAGPEPAP
ncbi:MAG: hypothetical protein KDE27_16530, partial [Planctomycetes bacterium]|nr:hypothetical protein [Planctomycetota bacterium]